MNMDYRQLTRTQLQAELAKLHVRCDTITATLGHDLHVHQEQLRAQAEELCHTQSLLEASRDEYAELYDFAPVSYLTLNHFGVVKSINLTGCAALGWERARILELPFQTFVSPSDRALFLEHMRRCRAGERLTSELKIQPRTGNSFPALLITGKVCGTQYRSAIMDLSDRKRSEESIRESHALLEERVQQRTAELERANEQLKQEIEYRKQIEQALQDANRRKDEFLAMLGHELRNPLAPIRNAADIIRLIAPNLPEVEEMRAIIVRQAEHMARIVDDLLDVSRISRGKISLHMVPIDLTKLLQEVLTDFESDRGTESIALQSELIADPMWVNGDSTRLSQIFGNLLHNAIKFTEPGGTIRIQSQQDSQERIAVVRISDTGIGIEPRMLPLLFQAFSQADHSLGRSRGGLGLGLALAKGLVELHGGQIEIHSPGLGQGTEVVVQIPLCIEAGKVTDTEKPVKGTRQYRVLIIDDQQDTLRTMHMLFKMMGHEVYTAATGEDGIRLAHEKRPHVIFSDIGLPDVDGYSVARAVREDPGSKSAYLVAVTGYGQREDERLAREAGFDRHLTKPIAFQEIQGLLSAIP